jgi:iron complex transport system substrate-binding protein
MDGPTPRPAARRKTLVYFTGLAVCLGVVIATIERYRNDSIPNRPATASAATPFPRRLTDASGAELTLTAPPQRIVSQTLATDEILLGLVEPTRIAALSELADDARYSHCADAARSVNLRTTQGAEHILSLKPDLIFVASYSRAEMVEILKAAHAPVFRFANFNAVADVKENIRQVGYAVGDDERAAKLIAELDRRLDAVRARAQASGRRPRVMSFAASGYTAGKNTSFDDVLRTLNAVNVSAENGVEGFRQISAEQLTRWNPEYIVASAEPGQEADVRRRLLENPAVAASAAGRAGNIVILESRDFTTISQHIARTAEALADALFGPAATAPK